MKKSTFLLGALLMSAATMTAQDEVVFANPTLPDGSFIVKYDLENHKFAEANDFEIDETFLFAVDVTGTQFEEALQQSSRNPAVVGRGMAHDFYVNNDVCGFEHYSNGGNLDGRLFHIEGNIYGATFNLFQLAVGRYRDTCYGLYEDNGEDAYDALKPGATVTFGSNIFAFGWSATNPGEEWWEAITSPIFNLWFTTAPYTGTKTGEDFWFDDFNDGPMFEGCEATNADKGYAIPEAIKELGGTGVEAIAADNTDAPAEYFNLQGIRVANPQAGIYVCRKGSEVKKVVIR